MGPIVDIGCGQGELVRVLLADGYSAEGLDISPEQVALGRVAILDRVLQGDYRDFLAKTPGLFAAVVAKDEVLDTFDRVALALMPGGIFVARVPNAVGPFGGHIGYGDFTHESWYAERCVQQLAAAAGFASVTVASCHPIVHGIVSAARLAGWKAISSVWKIVLAAETDVLRGHIVTPEPRLRRPQGSDEEELMMQDGTPTASRNTSACLWRGWTPRARSA
jgi:SAM-dependent methyltransferase